MDKNVKIPKFSILMINYNKANYIKEAINSVLNQTFQNWELIIIDDASTDDSLNRINAIKDSRIKIFRNKTNLGIIKNRKKIIEYAKTNILGILDSDDALYKNAVEIMCKIHIIHPNIAFAYSQFIYCDNKLNKKFIGYNRSISKKNSNLHYDSISHFFTFKKKCYLNTEGYDSNFKDGAEDKDIIYKLEEIGNGIFINKILYKYRILLNSISNEKEKKNICKINHILSKYNAYKRRLDSEIPNLKQSQIVKELFYALLLSIKLKDAKKIKYFLQKIIKIFFT